MVIADSNQFPLMRVAVPLEWGGVPEVAADPTGLQGYGRSIRREACRFPYIDFKAAVCWLARWKCIYRFPLPILHPLWKGETPPHTRLPTGLRLLSSRLFGPPSQVTVRPMLRDRCPVCLSVALMYCGQTVGWIKIPLGTEVGLSPYHIVLDGDPAPPQKGHTSPPFSAHAYCGHTAGWMRIPLGTEVGLGQGNFVLTGDPAIPRKGAQQPPIFGTLCSVTIAHLSNC